MKNQAAIYARLSREDEDKIDGSLESRSIENQIKALTEYAHNMDFEIYKIYYDDGVSGSTLDRPAFTNMLEDMKNQKFNTVIVKDLSRLGRSLHQVGELIETTFPKYNIRCIAITDRYDSLTYTGDESVVLRNFLNAYYLKDFKRKIHKSVEHRSKTKHMTTSGKYGYLVKKCGEVELDSYASKIVRRIFEQAIEGVSMPEIAKMLNEDNILPRAKYYHDVLKLPSNHKHHLASKWDSAMVNSILRDKEYCGHSLNLTHSTKETVLIKNTHPKIVTDEEFEIAQQNTKRVLKYQHLKPDHITLLIKDEVSNKCARCYYYSDVPRPYYYTSETKFKIDMEEFHNIIYKDIIAFITESRENMEKVYQRMVMRKTKARVTNPNELKSKLKELNNKYAKIFEDNMLGKLNDAKFKTESEKIETEIIKLENLINSISLETANLELLKKRFIHFVNYVDISSSDKLELIRTCVKVIYVSKINNENTIRIVYKFE